jgi:hypothetical protein
MKSIVNSFITRAALVSAMVFGLALVPAVTSYAAENCDTSKPVSVKDGKNCAKSVDQKGNLGNVIVDITNTLLFIIGAVAVIMIIIGGIRYTLSNGDSAQITSAKNTILYSVIGIVVALLAYAIVNFVITSFTSNTGEEGTPVRTET